MPIANCIVNRSCQPGDSNIVELWSAECGVTATHMTVNIVNAEQQFGKAYRVMAVLYLPSLWPAKDRSLLQLGLARALAKYFSEPLSEIQVITSIVESGHVVESGQTETW